MRAGLEKLAILRSVRTIVWTEASVKTEPALAKTTIPESFASIRHVLSPVTATGFAKMAPAFVMKDTLERTALSAM